MWAFRNGESVGRAPARSGGRVVRWTALMLEQPEAARAAISRSGAMRASMDSRPFASGGPQGTPSRRTSSSLLREDASKIVGAFPRLIGGRDGGAPAARPAGRAGLASPVGAHRLHSPLFLAPAPACHDP